uniref:Uncharacterized protein n=1 Tax=Scleropages formosus TaxID=113540 RepID=A0A8C9S973_SCLFO
MGASPSGHAASPFATCPKVDLWTGMDLLALLSFLYLSRTKSLGHVLGEQIGSGLHAPPEGSDRNSFLAPRDRRSIWKTGPREYNLQPGYLVPNHLLDFMGRQRKFKGRTRKNSSCFGLKVELAGAATGHRC